MNPFQYGKSDTTDLLYRFLFRGLIRYDTIQGAYQGDLMSCDLSNIVFIKCTLRDDAVWSDGTRVKTDDIIASLDSFRKNASDLDIKAFLETVSIKKDGETIELKSGQKSPHMLEILTYPIVKSDIIAAINSGTITIKNYTTSGPYILGEVVTDKEYWFDRISLFRNEKWAQSTWLDKIHFKFFRDLASLERSTEALTIVIPPVKTGKMNIGPRFREYPYTNYEYFSVFLNTRSMNRALRNSIHWQIGTSFSGNIAEDHRMANTIFQSGWAILPTGNLKGFSDILSGLGYTKKTEIISKIEQSSTSVSGEIVFKPTKYWTNKANIATLFVDSVPAEIILTGNVPIDTQSVSVNGYTLKEYIPGNTIFSYKVSVLWGTLIDGKNTYTLLVTLASGKTETETLTIYASADTKKLDEHKKQLQSEYDATQNTPALVSSRERLKEDKLKGAQQLANEYYYNNQNQVFTIKIWYITGPQSTELYAKHIDTALRLLGIKTELIAYGTKELQAMIATGERKYDLLVIGISVEGSLSSIGQIFSSSGPKSNSINFSSVDNKSLDALFSDLRGTTDIKKLEKIEQSISTIMNTESFFIPISSPYHRIWVDRNIRWIPRVDIIPDVASFVDVFMGTSIKENYIRDMQHKNISGFFWWILTKF